MSITINPPYSYQKISRAENEGKRLYLLPDGSKVPSVTTILGATGDKSHLIEWRKRVGDAEATRISTEAAGLGTLMHTHLENFILGEPRPTGNNQVRQMAETMADTIISNGLSQINEVWGMEISLYYPELFAGTTDLIGIYQGKPAIIDYKTTSKPKKKEWIEDYFTQLAFYGMAHNKVYGTTIDQGVIFMVSRAGEYQQFTIAGKEWQEFEYKACKRIDQYYSQI